MNSKMEKRDADREESASPEDRVRRGNVKDDGREKVLIFKDEEQRDRLQDSGNAPA